MTSEKNKRMFLIILTLVTILGLLGGKAVYTKKKQYNLLKKLEKDGVRAYAEVVEKRISLFNAAGYKKDDISEALLDFKKSSKEYGELKYVYFDAKQTKHFGIQYVTESIFRSQNIGDKIKIIYDPDNTMFSTTKENYEEKRDSLHIPEQKSRSWLPST